MVDHTSTTNIRRVYSRPWRDGGLANPGKVPTCIQVAVRPETTVFAHETMFAALTEMSAAGAGLAGIGRVHILDLDASRLRLVLDEGLELSPGPAVQASAHPFPSLDSGADVRQVLHHDLANPGFDRGLYDRLARFVIDALDTPHLLAGDLPELLFRALAAVGLETAAQGKVSVTLIAQLLATEDLAQTVGGEVVFSDIHAHHGAECHRFLVARFDDEVEEPLALAKHQFGFLGPAGFENAALMLAGAHRELNTPAQGVERQRIPLYRVGALVEMHAGAVEADFRNRLIFSDPPQFFLRLVRLTYRKDGVAAHLSAQRSRLAQVVVRPLVQTHPVPHSMLAYHGDKAIAGVCVSSAQCSKRFGLFCVHIQANRGCAHHRLSASNDIVFCVLYHTIWHACRTAVPPAIKIAGFLTGNL